MKTKEERIKEELDADIEYLEAKFPKGNKYRGEAMTLLALARIKGKEEKQKCKHE